MHLIVSLAALLGSAFTAASISHKSTVRPNIFIPGAYVVEFMDGHDHTSFYGSLRTDGVDVSPRMNMSFKLFNGASFSITNLTGDTQTASKISVMPAVKRIWPMRLYPAPEVQRLSSPSHHSTQHNFDFVSRSNNAAAAGNNTFSPHVMTQVDRLHDAGYTGEGARIAIIDTGVDYYHPALGGCFGKGCLISAGYDLVGESYDGTSGPEPGPDPYDNCIGHGTHVAGIIGARPNPLGFIGAAPGADLSMYKVFSCEGVGTSDDVLISAFNMAFENGSDIITASIGGPGGWSEDPWSSVVARIVDNGVPCTIAAGNMGDMGMWSPSSAADGKGVAAVASFDNAKTPYLLAKASYSTNSSGPCSAPKSFGWIPGYSPIGNLSLRLWATSHNSSVEDDACARLSADTPDLSQHIVLIRTSTACDPFQQTKNVVAFNAKYVLFYASSPEALAMADSYSISDKTKGSGMVFPEQGQQWVDLLSRGSDVLLTMVDPDQAGHVYAEVENKLTGGFASSYTSWGPTLELDVYPSIGTPGGNILSTYLLSRGGYRVASGTSMATPLAAAIYALVGQARGTFDPAELEMYLSSTSKLVNWNDGSGTLMAPAPVPQQGAGLVQAYDAVSSTTHLSTKSISFNDSMNIQKVTFTIQNLGLEEVTYQLENYPALTMNSLSMDSSYPQQFPNTIIGASADLEFSQSSVTLQPKGRADITVAPTFAAPYAHSNLLPVYSGYIIVKGCSNLTVQTLSIPYLGVLGAMNSTAVIDPEEDEMLGYDFSCSRAGEQSTYPDNVTFTLPYPTMENIPDGSDPNQLSVYPSAEFRLDFGTRVLRADVIPLSSNYSGPTTVVLGENIAGSVIGFPKYYLPRYPAFVMFSGMLEDGSVVPEGEYALAIRALQLFGDPDKPYDYDELPQIPFTLSYQDIPSKAAGRKEWH
ncbi:hypothetical protein Daus18300_001135 [Diaporthe australafricana]|uniref:Serin endopeptidase n=1 Tax=Diaporthe australafricana TaxID=127596 RepID=A0ABR3XZ41_9PEZI